MKHSSYWKERAEQLEERAHKKTEELVKSWEEEYKKATARIEREIEFFYQKIGENQEVSAADARKLLNQKDLKEFRWDLEEFIEKAKENEDLRWEKELQNASARVRINWLEREKIMLEQITQELFSGKEQEIKKYLTETLEKSITDHKKMLEDQSGEKILRKIDKKAIEKIINTPWTVDGRTFSSRIWQNHENLNQELKTILVQSAIRGDHSFEAAADMAKKMHTSQFNAARLLYTETAFFQEKGTLEAYKAAKIKEIQILATLDRLTCEECGSLDGEIILAEEAEIGVNVPLFHPFCRCTTVAYFKDMEDLGERPAETPEGDVEYVPANTKYSDYKKNLEKDLTGGEDWGIIGVVTSSGSIIREAASHFFEQMFSRDLSIDTAIFALKSPLYITETVIKNGKPSCQYIGEEATVAYNPIEHRVLTVWKTGKSKRKKYMNKNEDHSK